MPTYRIQMELDKPILIKADNEDEAVDKAFDEIYGSISDKKTIEDIDLVVSYVKEI